MNVMEYYEEMGHCPSCKKLKALEIIKVILFSKLKVFETTEKAEETTITKGNYYVIEFRVGKEKEQLYIPKEEYDLLKEVLK